MTGHPTPWCSLPDLPEVHNLHTQTGLEACGGLGTSGGGATCVTLSGGSWVPSHNLRQGRASPFGTVLMGGEYDGAGETTELLDPTTGESVMYFPPQFDTRLT